MKREMDYEYNEKDGMYYPKLDYPEDDIELGRLGRMRFDYLHDHNQFLYAKYLMDGTLLSHCKEVENKAAQKIDAMVEQQMDKCPEDVLNDFELKLKYKNTAYIEAESFVIREYVLA